MTNYKIRKHMDDLMVFAETLPGSDVYYREDWDTIYFDLKGKQFGLMSPTADEEAFITLKNIPEINEELRETYAEVVFPGYYTNKTHWNSILINQDVLPINHLCQLIQTSYDLVYAKLTKKKKQEILDSLSPKYSDVSIYSKEDETILVQIWEDSVRATHGFLKETDLLAIKKELPTYFDLVDLEIYYVNNQVIGFSGVHNHHLEMLFLDPSYFRQGHGQDILIYLNKKYDIKKIDVNKDNISAYSFYKKLGYHIVNESTVDAQGRPYPILHLQKIEKEIDK